MEILGQASIRTEQKSGLQWMMNLNQRSLKIWILKFVTDAIWAALNATRVVHRMVN